jgi:hypothetical protein
VTEQLEIERDRNRVILILNLADDYAAIEAYEKLIVQAREGFVLLDVETAGASDA